MLDILEAEKFVKNRDNNITKITTSQIRKFLAAVNRISNMIMISNSPNDELDEDIINEIKYMQIQFAYLVGKSRSSNNHYNEMKKLYDHLKSYMSSINTKSSFKKFSQYIEAIVAYHKFYGGK